MRWKWDRTEYFPPELGDFEAGLIIGLLIGEVHFGGDQRQAQVTLKLREKDEDVLKWVQHFLPGGRIYGPYSYVYKADGKTRTTYQLMYRGRALRQQLIPFLDRYDWAPIAPRVYERYRAMKERYDLFAEASHEDVPEVE